MNVHDAIKELRERLGETQRDFSRRLKLSIHAVINYESGFRSPPPGMLFLLMSTAYEYGYPDLTKVFQDAVEGLVGREVPPYQFTETMRFGKDEAEDVMALVALLRSRDPKHKAALTEWRRISASVKEENRGRLYRGSDVAVIYPAVHEGLRAGLNDTEILAKIPREHQPFALGLIQNARTLAQAAAHKKTQPKRRK